MLRVREYEARTGSGFADPGTGQPPDSTTVGMITEHGYCADIVGEGNGQNLAIRKIHAKGGVMNGSKTFEDGHTLTISNYVIGGGFRSNIGPLEVDPGPSDGEIATKILASTNPSRPKVDLPTFIGELKDFPSLFEFAGRSIFRRSGFQPQRVFTPSGAASTYLNYNFGWAPLIGDLMKMLQFTDIVNKRTRELETLKRSGLRRKRRFHRATAVREINGQIQQTFCGVSGKRSTTTTLLKEAFVKWTPLDEGWPSTPDAMRQLAIKAAFGLYLSPSTAWELLPWSWLVDWFANVGDYLNASRNIVPCHHSKPQVMKQTITEELWTYSDIEFAEFSVDPMTYMLVTKERVPTDAIITASLPYLSTWQASILGAVGILANPAKMFTRR